MSYLARLAARAQPGGTLLEPPAPVPGGEPEEVATAAEPLALQRPQPMPQPDREPRPLEPSAPLAVPEARLDPPRAVTVEASAPSPAQPAAAAPPPPAATRQEVAQPPAAAPLRPVAPAQAATASERRPPAPVAEFAASSKHARVEDVPAPTASEPHELLVSEPAAAPMGANAPMSPTAPAAWRAAPTERVVLVPAVADPVVFAPAPPDERPRLVIGRLEVEVVPQEPPAAAPRRAVPRRVSAAPPAARQSSLRFGLGQI